MNIYSTVDNPKRAWDKITLDFCSRSKTDKRREQKHSFGNKPKFSKIIEQFSEIPSYFGVKHFYPDLFQLN